MNDLSRLDKDITPLCQYAVKVATGTLLDLNNHHVLMSKMSTQAAFIHPFYRDY